MARHKYQLEGRVYRTEIRPKVLKRYPRKDQIIFILRHLPEIEDRLLDEYRARFPVLRNADRNHHHSAAEIYEELTRRASSDPELKDEIEKEIERINSILKRMNARCYREIVLHDSYAEERKRELKAAKKQKASENDEPFVERIRTGRGRREETSPNAPPMPLIKIPRTRQAESDTYSDDF